MTEFSCTPPQIPHIDGFELEMLKPSVFEERFPEIERVPNRVIATTDLGAIATAVERQRASYEGFNLQTENITVVQILGLHDRTKATQVTFSDQGTLAQINYLAASTGIVSRLGQRFGFVGDMYKPVYCDNQSGSANAIGVDHYAGHLAKDEPEFPMASLQWPWIQHDSFLGNHPLGMMAIDEEARHFLRDRIRDNLHSSSYIEADEIVNCVSGFDGLSGLAGEYMYQRIYKGDQVSAMKLITDSMASIVGDILLMGEASYCYALSQFTEYPLPFYEYTDISGDELRVAQEVSRALNRTGLPDMRHFGLSEQTKAILEMADRVAAREQQIGQVIVRELEAVA